MSRDSDTALLLRDTLAEHATSVVVPVDLADVVRRRGRRQIARRRAATAFAAVVALVFCALGVTVAVSHNGGRRVAGVALPDWPPRGTAVGDQRFINAAMNAWNTATGETHHLREVIFAGEEPIGPAALLLATDPSGQLRLGGLVGDPAKHEVPTTLIEDHVVTAPLVAASLVHQKIEYQPVLVLVTDPSATSATWISPDGEVGGCTFYDGVDIWAFNDISQVPSSVNIATADGTITQVPIG